MEGFVAPTEDGGPDCEFWSDGGEIGPTVIGWIGT